MSTLGNPSEPYGSHIVSYAEDGWWQVESPDLDDGPGELRVFVAGFASDEDEARAMARDYVDLVSGRAANPRRLPNIIVRKPEAENFLRKSLRGRKTDYYVLSEPKNLGGPYSSLAKAKQRLRQVEYFKRAKPGRKNNPFGWTEEDVEAANYAITRWSHAHHVAQSDPYRGDVSAPPTWREFADWIRATREPGSRAIADIIQHLPGRPIDFPVRVEPMTPSELAPHLTPSRSTLNPRAPGLSPMLGELENMLGPLSQGHKDAILDYIEDPTEEKWDRIHSLVLTPGSLRLATMWQWVRHVDPSFPSSRPSGDRWPKIPDPFTVARAIRAAAERRGRRGNRGATEDLGWRKIAHYEGVLHPGDYTSDELAPGIRYELRRRSVWDVWLVRGHTATRVGSARDLEGARNTAARDAREILELAREIAAASPRHENPPPVWDLQTVIVSKDVAPTRAKATTIAREHAKRIYTSRETKDSWRFRQRPPGDFVKGSFRTRPIPGLGISLVYGRLKRGVKPPAKRRRRR